MTAPRTIGIIGARGYAGAELIHLIEAHPSFQLECVSSRKLNGEALRCHISGVDNDLHFELITPADLKTRKLDAWVLALPNNLSAPYVEAIDAHQPNAVIVDLSADHRFTEAWTYGLPERNRQNLHGAKRISNPGCYATGIQLAVAPLLGSLQSAPTAFGVSGYSGAGTTPSDKNDTEKLRNNMMPYKLVNHTHEREVTRHLQQEIFFCPHVAPFFRGITLTVSMPLSAPFTPESLRQTYETHYQHEPLVKIVDNTPHVRDICKRCDVEIGGLSLDPKGRRAVVVVTLDNLLKGASSQALQNLNLAFGLDELTGLPT